MTETVERFVNDFFSKPKLHMEDSPFLPKGKILSDERNAKILVYYDEKKQRVALSIDDSPVEYYRLYTTNNTEGWEYVSK